MKGLHAAHQKKAKRIKTFCFHIAMFGAAVSLLAFGDTA